MKAIGIRVSNTYVCFSVVKNISDRVFEVINIEYLKIPNALDFPQQLKYLRNVILDILREYSITKAGIKVVEGNADNKATKRMQIEGVIQEAFASSLIQDYFIGRSSSITSRIQPLLSSKKNFKSFIKTNSTCEFISNWEKCSNDDKKESTLVGVAALL